LNKNKIHKQQLNKTLYKHPVKRLKSPRGVGVPVAGESDDTRTRLETLLGTGPLKERLEALQAETGGLLDEAALLALLADEHGLAATPFRRLSDLEPSASAFALCTVEIVEPIREFRGRDRIGRLRKLRVSDGSASLALTLWDEETGLVEQLGLVPGSRIRILGAALRETRYGREIHVGRSGFVMNDGAPPEEGPSERRDLGQLEGATGRADVGGVVLSLASSGRGRQKTTTFRLFDGTGEAEVVVPHGQVQPPPGLAPGVEMELLNARIERREGRPVLVCDGRSELKMK
jgi:hypothetical protein